MTTCRNLAWSAAVRDLKADFSTRPPIREERMHAALSAWRGLSGRRYLVRSHDLTLDALEAAGDAVCFAVARAEDGSARIANAVTGLSCTEAVEWLCRAVRAGATELHVHRLADNPAERAAIVADLTEF